MNAYESLKLFLGLVVRIFFREIEVVGLENIPRSGPVIFVGNHQNQFVDPLILLTTTPRRVGFIIADKSYKRPIIGDLAKLMNSIPVVRAQDLATKGIGTITVEGTQVLGTSTKFTTQFQPNTLLGVSGQEATPRIVEIISDTELKIDQPFAGAVKNSPFKILPKLDQKVVYEKVWDTLGHGGSIGIFPEGGSHDRTEMLPLKAGVSLMALGAAAQRADVPISIIPCGLNYFHGHKFRSHVLVQFGKPIVVSPEMVEKYHSDKRGACGELLDLIHQKLRSVTLNAPDYQTLQAIYMARRLWTPSGVELSVEQYLNLNRKFALAYDKLLNEPKIAQLKEQTSAYIQELKSYTLKDHQITGVQLNKRDAISMLIGRFVFFVVMVLLSIPGVLPFLPAGLAARFLARREAKKAKASSDVKIAGRDVIASYKLLVAIVFFPLSMLLFFFIMVLSYGLMTGILAVFFLPFLSYASVKLGEEAWLTYKSSIPLLYSVTPSGKTYFARLKRIRTELKKNIRAVVDEFGPRLGPEIWDETCAKIHFSESSGDISPFELNRRTSYKKASGDDE